MSDNLDYTKYEGIVQYFSIEKGEGRLYKFNRDKNREFYNYSVNDIRSLTMPEVGDSVFSSYISIIIKYLM